jgi:hypothetical protein
MFITFTFLLLHFIVERICLGMLKEVLKLDADFPNTLQLQGIAQIFCECTVPYVHGIFGVGKSRQHPLEVPCSLMICYIPASWGFQQYDHIIKSDQLDKCNNLMILQLRLKIWLIFAIKWLYFVFIL